MQNKFTPSASKVLVNAMNEAKSLGHTYIGTEHLLLGILNERDSVAADILENNGVEYSQSKELVAQISGKGDVSCVDSGDMTPKLKKIIENAANDALKVRAKQIGTEGLLSSLVAERECVAVKVIIAQGANPGDIQGDVGAFNSGIDGLSRAVKRKSDGDIAQQSSVLSFGKDLTAQARDGKTDPIIGRNDESDRVIQILCRRTKNNPCLIGEPGVGKTAVVEGLAAKIASGAVPETLEGKRIITLDVSSMIAGAKYRGEFEERLKKVLDETVKNKSIILFIDEIHTIVGAGAAEGAVDAANILKPALARGDIQVIGATTLDEYRRHIEKDAALERRFQPVVIEEPTPEETVTILRGLREKYEEHHKIKITDEAISAAVSLSTEYITDRYLPDKAIDLIDEAAAKKRIEFCKRPAEMKRLEKELESLIFRKEKAICSQDYELAAEIRDKIPRTRVLLRNERDKWEREKDENTNAIYYDDIARVVTLWTKIPVRSGNLNNGENLLGLEEKLKESVIGQDSAVSAVSRAVRRGRTGLKNPDRPMTSLLFAGPSGVGKTETAKATAKVLFGDENSLIRLDMSEYMEKHSISKLIGSPPGYIGYDDGGQLTERVRRHSYCVVLFDEIEKAHPDVFGILLQILEDGALTDSTGRKVSFKNAVVIMTTNIGGAKDKVSGFSAADNGKTDISEIKTFLRPELINRIDEIIPFDYLKREDMLKICIKMLDVLKARVEKIGVTLSFGEDVAEFLCGDIPKNAGARPLRMKITSMLEDGLSSCLVLGTVKTGDTVKAGVSQGKIVFENISR